MSSPTDPPSLFPTLFVSHGGGPLFFMSASETGMGSGMDKDSKAAHWYRGLASSLALPCRPEALVVVSAHWESSDEVKVTARQDNPDLLYDYGGFPAHTYELKYPAPGQPALSRRIVDLLQAGGIKASLETKRNFDHGVFIPLKLIYPDADIPVVQVSLLRSMDPKAHIAIGRALAPLRASKVLIIGSGFATHAFHGLSLANAKQFVTSLDTSLTAKSGADREADLTKWATAFPHARTAHPREEHLIPLHVAVGAAGEAAKGKKLFDYIAEFGSSAFAMTSWRFD